MTTYNNFKEFKKEYPSIAKKLLNDVGSGDWQDNEICFHGNPEEFCNYELTEGWYSTRFGDIDYNGAPNPLDYIDYESFFNALSSNWDTSCNWTNDEVVVFTTYGW